MQYRAKIGEIELGSEEHLKLLFERSEAVGVVKLFGDENLCQQIDRIVEVGEMANTAEFMNDLRDRVRDDYGLEPTESRYKWIEFRPRENAREADQ